MSFHWYPFIGTIIVWIIGIPLSYIYGSNPVNSVNPNLISPIARFLLPPQVWEGEMIPKLSVKKVKDLKDGKVNDNEVTTYVTK